MPAKKRSTVIDADGHVSDTGAVNWADYVDEDLRSVVPRRVRDEQGNATTIVEGRTLRTWGKGASFHGPVIKGNAENFRPGMVDPAERLKDMDLEGIDVAVLFGGLISLGASGLVNGRLATQLSHAYNTWLHGYCSAAPARLKGVASVALQDVETAAGELRRAVTELGFVGGALPTNSHGRNLDDPSFDPFYAEAERLNVPVCIHIASFTNVTPGIQGACIERFDKFFFTHTVLHPFEQMMACMSIVCGGVLERFPRLRVAFLEAGCGWAPYWMHRLDEHYERLAPQVRATRPPSEAIRSEQCFISCEPDEAVLPTALKLIGEERVVYASDYCHYDSSFPDSARIIRERTDLTARAKEKLLSSNARALFGLS